MRLSSVGRRSWAGGNHSPPESGYWFAESLRSICCAEQSVVQETLDACTAEHVGQLYHALDEIYRAHSQGFRHDYQARWQLLDVDMSGLPCGPKAAFATRGDFAGLSHRRG
jgi:hypothetical protein